MKPVKIEVKHDKESVQNVAIEKVVQTQSKEEEEKKKLEDLMKAVEDQKKVVFEIKKTEVKKPEP